MNILTRVVDLFWGIILSPKKTYNTIGTACFLPASIIFIISSVISIAGFVITPKNIMGLEDITSYLYDIPAWPIFVVLIGFVFEVVFALALWGFVKIFRGEADFRKLLTGSFLLEVVSFISEPFLGLSAYILGKTYYKLVMLGFSMWQLILAVIMVSAIASISIKKSFFTVLFSSFIVFIITIGLSYMNIIPSEVMQFMVRGVG